MKWIVVRMVRMVSGVIKVGGSFRDLSYVMIGIGFGIE